MVAVESNSQACAMDDFPSCVPCCGSEAAREDVHAVGQGARGWLPAMCMRWAKVHWAAARDLPAMCTCLPCAHGWHMFTVQLLETNLIACCVHVQGE